MKKIKLTQQMVDEICGKDNYWVSDKVSLCDAVDWPWDVRKDLPPLGRAVRQLVEYAYNQGIEDGRAEIRDSIREILNPKE